MSRKARDKEKATKFEPVAVAPLPATSEERERHLRHFIRHFIRPGRQSRWLPCLLENPTKAYEHLHRFEHDHDPRYCVELSGANSFPQSLSAVYSPERGFYCDGEEPDCKMTAAEAATMAALHFRDALVSFGPGKGALFLHHDGSAWWCECR